MNARKTYTCMCNCAIVHVAARTRVLINSPLPTPTMEEIRFTLPRSSLLIGLLCCDAMFAADSSRAAQGLSIHYTGCPNSPPRQGKVYIGKGAKELGHPVHVLYSSRPINIVQAV